MKEFDLDELRKEWEYVIRLALKRTAAEVSCAKGGLALLKRLEEIDTLVDTLTASLKFTSDILRPRKKL